MISAGNDAKTHLVSDRKLCQTILITPIRFSLLYDDYGATHDNKFPEAERLGCQTFTPKVRGSNPALADFFHVFESFQGPLRFLLLGSFMKYHDLQQGLSVQNRHFFVIILT